MGGVVGRTRTRRTSVSRGSRTGSIVVDGVVVVASSIVAAGRVAISSGGSGGVGGTTSVWRRGSTSR